MDYVAEAKKRKGKERTEWEEKERRKREIAKLKRIMGACQWRPTADFRDQAARERDCGVIEGAMTAKLLEKDVQRACEDLLLLDGFEIIRREKNWSEKKKKATGETGAADCMAVRYLEHYQQGIPLALAEVLHIEWKRPRGGRYSIAQNIWHSALRKRGAVTWRAGREFEPTYGDFKAHYEASGLCRRRLK